MPMNKKATLLLLEYMKRTIEQMPNDVKINRFFMYGGGAGIILDSGIYDAARELNKGGLRRGDILQRMEHSHNPPGGTDRL